jgi:hypothetical protein
VEPGDMAGSAEVPGLVKFSNAGYEMLILGSAAARVNRCSMSGTPRGSSSRADSMVAGGGYCSNEVETVGCPTLTKRCSL